MKNVTSLFLALIMVFSLCIGLISCGNTNNPDDDDEPSTDNPSDNNPTSEPFSVDLAGYVANIGNATALGLSKKAKSEVSPVASYGKSHSGIQLLSHSTLASEKNSKSKKYIVMSTTEYDANAPEADETGLTKVTFTKIVTENVITEVSGEKVIKAHKDGLSFHAVEGFTYSVYEGDTLIYEGVMDNDENDGNNRIGKILLVGLTDKVDYTVKYSGKGTETTITQDDINGEIDKMYVLNDYTFISFVPEGQSQRPEDNALNYDPNGVATYDKIGYYSNATRQSFVIDNSTGYVYQIKDIPVEEIKNNLILISGKIYDMRVTENDELQFYTIVQNETLTISDFYRDNYGNVYIENEYIDFYDEENNTLYYKPSNQHTWLAGMEIKKFTFTKDGYALKIDYNGCCPSVVKIGPNFSEEAITVDDYFYIDRLFVIKDGYLYNTREFNRTNLIIHTHTKDDYSCGWIFAGSSNLYSGISHYDFIDLETVIFYTDDGHYGSKPKTIYYQNIFGDTRLNDPQIPEEGETFENSIILLENVEIERMGSSFETWKFKKITISETLYYQIVVDENGVPKFVNSETYVAPEQDVVTLQPLNK